MSAIGDFAADAAPAGGCITLRWSSSVPAAAAPRARLFRSDDAHPVRDESGRFDVSRSTYRLVYDSEVFLREGPYDGYSVRLGRTRSDDRDGDATVTRTFQFRDLRGEMFLEQEVTFREGEEISSRFRFLDRALSPRTYYYALLVEDESGKQYQFVDTAPAPDGAFDFGGRLYDLMPALYRRYQRSGAGAGEAPLKRFLQLIGGALDRQASADRGLLEFHDPRRAPGPMLTLLADAIGWWVGPQATYPVQRNRLLGAVNLYRRSGTLPAVEDLVYQAAGKPVRVREFSKNVFHSNAPEVPYLTSEDGWVLTRSKTVDTSGVASPARYGDHQDVDDLELLRTWRDTLHYTFDSRKPAGWYRFDADAEPDGWYRYDTIGLFLQEEVDPHQRQRILSAADYYLPLHVRAVLIQASTVPVNLVVDLEVD